MSGRGGRQARRSGLSLLEVMLAIAILGMSLVVLAELMRIGSRASREAREITIAQLLCEAKMAEVALGMIPAQAANQQPCETDPNWVYSIEVQPADETGLLMVMVQVTEAQPVGVRPLEFTLTRLMVDPATELAAEAAAAEAAAAASEASSTSGAASGTSGTSGTSGASGGSTSGS